MKRKWSVVFATVLLTLPLFGCVAYPIRAEVGFHESVPAAAIKTLVVESRNGAIDVTCEAGREAMDIDATRYANGVTLEDARQYAEQIEIEAGPVGDSGVFRIVAKFPEPSSGRSAGANFRIVMPPSAALDLKTSNGRVEASGAGGTVTVKTSNGPVTVIDAKEAVSAHTTNGRIKMQDVAGDVEAHSSNGAIELERVGAARVTAHTTNGRIKAMDTRGDVELKSSNGTVVMRAFSVPDKPNLTSTTSNGNVTMELPATVKARVQLRTSNGKVYADFKDATVKDLETDRNQLSATLNEGAGNVEARVSNGSVTLRTVGGKG
jgi:hypothetical protein